MVETAISRIINIVMDILRFKGFYARSSLFTLLSLVSAVFSYALYPILVRILNPSEFGDFAAIMALTNQTMAVLAAVNVVSVYLVKTLGESEARSRVQTIQKTLMWLFFGLTILVTLFSPALGHFLHIKGLGMFLALGLILILSIPVSLWTGYLQGHKELVRIGVFTVISTIAKLFLAIILAFPFGPLGALVGVLLGTVFGIAVINFYPGVKLPNLRSSLKRSTKDERIFLSGMKFYIMECIFVIGALGVLQNIDIVFAKLLFSSDIAGRYSGISVLSNALYYLCFLLIWIVVPEIEINNSKVNRRLLRTAYKIICAFAIAVLSTEFLLRDYLSKLLLGSNFSGQGSILIFASLYQLSLVSVVLYAYYLLVCRKSKALLLASLVLVCSLSFPILWHSSPLVMIRSLWLALCAAVSLYSIIRLVYSKIHKNS